MATFLGVELSKEEESLVLIVRVTQKAAAFNGRKQLLRISTAI